MRLKIRHNMQVAHRLTKTPGKCQQIHGHGMEIELVFVNLEYDDATAMVKNRDGIIFEFGAMKKAFRTYIDEGYDHHLLLNKADTWAGPIYQTAEIKTWLIPKEMREEGTAEDVLQVKLTNEQAWLPGLVLMDDDPTVENLALWIAMWAAETFHADTICRLEETNTNGAECFVVWTGFGGKVVI
jgi:6-pyruvoyltetrahydropterin/6-carboxytetrahydropterin synthase